MAYEKKCQKNGKIYDTDIKTVKFQLSDYVTLSIPTNECTSTDSRRLPCQIINVSGREGDFYKVASCHGIISGHYRIGNLTKHSGSMKTNTTKEITLQEAVCLENQCNKFVRNKCSCIDTCKSNRCCCKTMNIKCTTHCHPRHLCQ